MFKKRQTRMWAHWPRGGGRSSRGQGPPLLALDGEMPPGARCLTIHEAGDGDEHVQHTRVMPGVRGRAKALVQLIRTQAGELCGLRDPQAHQIGRHGGADVGQVGQAGDSLADDFAGVHGVHVVRAAKPGPATCS